MKFYTYILKSKKDNSYYVGSTNSIENRLRYHNKGKVKSTKYKRPLQLIYKEEYPTLTEAIKRERQIKSWKKRKEIEKLIEKSLAPSSSG